MSATHRSRHYLTLSNGRCYLCGVKMLAEYVESPFGTSVTRDHVVPRKMVQKTIKMPPKPKKSVSKRTMRAWRQACQSIYEANLRGCCARCNHSKGGRSLTPNLVAELAASRIESVCPCD